MPSDVMKVNSGCGCNNRDSRHLYSTTTDTWLRRFKSALKFAPSSRVHEKP
ncbi:predicted protein [Sclerotinia sclerotiorum 1980 UF-70]|uniref:Uncharacterized protein n=1 Tax=Sclerotinia sclerotiorum (strain ATCC 18683 / 1980 / Ss-1) TaxID=665079 RepID=A7E9T2_SCLS1|nr:predicted protein [Sclerotinia sclerotiorum 1980 UF-70]EDN97134.1 predicted protein [Sclerotinia sclerotiorum 1980 UF-70]